MTLQAVKLDWDAWMENVRSEWHLEQAVLGMCIQTGNFRIEARFPFANSIRFAMLPAKHACNFIPSWMGKLARPRNRNAKQI